MAIKKMSIPAKFQLPMAIVLGVLLIVLLGVKTGRIQPKEILAKLKADDVNQLEMISMDSMMAMIGEASEVLATRDTAQVELIHISRDPFRRPVTTKSPLAVSVPSESNSTTHKKGRSFARADWLDEAEVGGTLLTKGQFSALMNGRYIREGDKIEGFEVVRIIERAVVLADEFGESVVHMPEE
jgi:hypothetical protein